MLQHLLPHLQSYQIVLASQSPRRRHLLSELGINFDVVVKKDVDESFDASWRKEKIAKHLASHKAAQYYNELMQQYDNPLIVTADTIVWINGQVLNKPADVNEAVAMLQTLSGNKHHVVTGVCLMSRNKKKVFHDTAAVYFRALSDAEIHYYIETCKPFDKAGSYGVQEWIGYTAIERIEGSFFNVMGLPVHRLYAHLKDF